ncbi:hypothetical protein DFR59_106143 [Falsibacillus pallidus]|uniref:Uncharacterized protein n=1 Tax=Falsibacillus pallidus TaxID=493781 RepID=A0A370GHX8_9BACI|nr:hypothetical protein DFR59_106143 [Falsibacillus pallidus]
MGGKGEICPVGFTRWAKSKEIAWKMGVGSPRHVPYAREKLAYAPRLVGYARKTFRYAPGRGAFARKPPSYAPAAKSPDPRSAIFPKRPTHSAQSDENGGVTVTFKAPNHTPTPKPNPHAQSCHCNFSRLFLY